MKNHKRKFTSNTDDGEKWKIRNKANPGTTVERIDSLDLDIIN
jgi:hypothetical protein